MASVKPAHELEDKIIIVTGANTGIGYETALDLARKGADVILGCRDLSRGKAALDKIKLETKNEKVYLEQIELNDFDSVRDFVKRFKQKWNRLDVLVNNAGLSNETLKKNKNGIEMTFAVNHLGHFLLTNLLLDVLKASAPSRIINVSSMLHKYGSIKWEDINLEKNFSGFSAYSQSKLANVYFTMELAKRLEGTNVTAVALCPGPVSTELNRDQTGCTAFCCIPLFKLIAKEPKQGAQTTIHCTVNSDVPNHSGAFYSDSKLYKLSKKVRDSPDTTRFWDFSETLVQMKE